MTMSRRLLVAVVIVIAEIGGVAAHVGSPDVFVDAAAGPYRTFVTVRPPVVIPGVADVEVRVATPGAQTVLIVPMPMTGEGARFAPAPEQARVSPNDPQFFTGQLWMMTAGAWQVRVTVRGEQGEGVVSVPVPTLPQQTRGMSRSLAVLLFALMMLLVAGAVSVVSAMAREASLEAGDVVTPARKRRGRIAGAIAAVAIALIVSLGNLWWRAEAASYSRYVYKPLQGRASIDAQSRLTLSLTDPGWIRLRQLDDFVADHGHVMHLFVVSSRLDRLWHLHPTRVGAGLFEEMLPEDRAGSLEYFADVVHASGIAETVTGEVDSAGTAGGSLGVDDSTWSGAAARALEYPLADGGRIIWIRDERPITAKQLTMFSFRVEDDDGAPAADLELYMGMPGHAVFIRKDRKVFAHVHPSGSAPMAAMAISAQSLDAGSSIVLPPGHGMTMHGPAAPGATVSFPYGIPTAGPYRIFVQIKRHGRVETAAFDVDVKP